MSDNKKNETDSLITSPYTETVSVQADEETTEDKATKAEEESEEQANKNKGVNKYYILVYASISLIFYALGFLVPLTLVIVGISMLFFQSVFSGNYELIDLVYLFLVLSSILLPSIFFIVKKIIKKYKKCNYKN